MVGATGQARRLSGWTGVLAPRLRAVPVRPAPARDFSQHVRPSDFSAQPTAGMETCLMDYCTNRLPSDIKCIE